MKTKTKISKDLKFKRNPRKISNAQLELLRNHLSELGDLSGVIYCHNNKAYVGGNQRSDVFDNSQIEITERFSEPTKQKTLAHGFIVWQGEKYAYREVAFTESEFKKACIVANHDGGTWDMEILRTEFDIPELAEWGFEVPEFDTVYESKDAEPQVNKAKELNKVWGVKRGDLFSIGNHRLLCGDSTLPEDVLRLMGNEKADMVFTDPPYGVGYDYDLHDDNMSVQEYKDFCIRFFKNLNVICENIIMTPACVNMDLWNNIKKPKHIGIWVKTNAMTHGVITHFWAWEPIYFYGSFKKKRANDVFNFPIGMQKDTGGHTCPKPLSLISDIVENFSEENELIYDGFLGSGTTMIAAQNLNRRCFGMEISPDYVAVCLERIKNAYPDIEISLCPQP